VAVVAGNGTGEYEFRATGKFRGRPATVTWKGGEVSGDAELVEALRKLAEEREGQIVAMGDLHRSETQHLSDPIAAYVLVRELLGREATVTGNMPRRKPLPPGWKT
jgi:hypothetical protein